MGQEQVPQRAEISVARPADFDSYWSAVLSEVAAVPLDPTLRHLRERSTAEVDVYEIHYSSLDNLRIAGWYCVPRPEHIEPPYPALILGPGYISEPALPKEWARLGYAALSLAPRGKLRSNARFNPGYPGLLVNNIVDRNTYSYRGFYMDACRGVDFAQARPEVDASRIGVNGHSQGGALAIVIPALRPEAITCSASGSPYLTDFFASARLTHSYPYEEINEYLRSHPSHEKRARDALAYFDCLNFAPTVRCPMLMYIGLADDICPPETGLAAYTALQCEKQLLTAPGCSHEAGRRALNPQIEAFLAAHLNPMSGALREVHCP